jgi:hypothetical protein
MRQNLERLACLAAALAGVAALGGCHDATIARRDGVTFQAGDAVAANKAIHIIDPWPASARSARLPASGTQAVSAIERLETRNAAAAAASGGASGGASPSAVAPGATAAGAR